MCFSRQLQEVERIDFCQMVEANLSKVKQAGDRAGFSRLGRPGTAVVVLSHHQMESVYTSAFFEQMT